MSNDNFSYCESLVEYKRQTTQEVKIGDLKLGGDQPIRVQSMTDTNTLDAEATVNQVISIIEAGADLVRITAQGVREASNLEQIKKELVKRGYTTPIVADIHFNPAAAEIAAQHVDKVRINPGNFADKRANFKTEFSDEEYLQGLENIKEKFIPFLRWCQKNNTALRVGTNHGSLSDRIMSRYGDTPEGMVEATLEYLRLCKQEEFNNVVISIKSSNTRVMVQTVRLLNNRMRKEGITYPFHIGVTEAGEGEDGRIKSAVGSGALLADGLGDTVRISLTEHPAKEIPVGQKLVKLVNELAGHAPVELHTGYRKNPFVYERRKTRAVDQIGGDHVPVVLTEKNTGIEEQVPDYFFKSANLLEDQTGIQYPVLNSCDFLKDPSTKAFVNITLREWHDLDSGSIEKIRIAENHVFLLHSENKNSLAEQRAFFLEMEGAGITTPVIICRDYLENEIEDLQLRASLDLGGLLIDGFGDGILITNKGSISDKEICSTAFGILQAGRMRISKTEFISCPGCGRTLFNLQDTVAKVKKHFAHLKGLKIGVMGCIVNGPGEMGDVDYGYVGAGAGKVHLYRRQELVKRNIPEEAAVIELEKLIREHGEWREPVNKKSP